MTAAPFATCTCVPPRQLAPVVVDLAKDLLRHRTLPLRYPLGMMEISNRKLLATGFRLPYGFEAALDLALEPRAGRPVDDAVAAKTPATS